MSRVIKEPEVRRQEIIQAAQSLFVREGYRKTSVEAIIKEAGIAKGTFYYYFKAKQDVLKAIVDGIADDLETHFLAIAENRALSPIEKLKEMTVGTKKQQTIQPDIMEIVDLPENRELQEQLNIKSVLVIAPLMARVLTQGFDEGVFSKKASEESVQLMLAGVQFVLGSGLFKWSEVKTKKLLTEAQSQLEFIAGVKQGTFEFISKV